MTKRSGVSALLDGARVPGEAVSRVVPQKDADDVARRDVAARQARGGAFRSVRGHPRGWPGTGSTSEIAEKTAFEYPAHRVLSRSA